MDKFIKLSREERKNIIQKASFDLGLRFDVVEKDIWVCFVLDKLFSLKELEGKLVFKGGTCLSKAYNLIERFSEDIDITIDKSCLEIIDTSKKPKEIKSRTKKAAEQFVQEKIFKILNEAFVKELKDDWNLEIDSNDKSTINFQFPISDDGKRFLATDNGDKVTTSDGSKITVSLGYYNYIKPRIKLEFGATGDIYPSEEKLVEPYAKQILPDIFESSRVKVLDVRRNFLEKLLILHSIHYRPIDTALKNHYSRHYYDVFALIKAGVGDEALKLPDVLKSVIQNKIDFWNESWKPYDFIKSFANIKIIPKEESRIKELQEDYKKMTEMFFKDYPTFSEIITELKRFEASIIKT